MKKALFIIAYAVVGILLLCYLPRLLALLLYKTVFVYVLLSVATYISLVVGLYWLSKKRLNPDKVKMKKGVFVMLAIFLFFLYMFTMIFAWKYYDWHFCIDNGTDENIEFSINGEPRSVLAKSFSNSYDLNFHCPAISVTCKGEAYRFEKPGDYVFNIDALNSYYIIKHEVQYSFADISFILTDNITDTIRNQVFFELPCHIDEWFKYPEQVYIQITKDKRSGEETRRNKPKYIYSIQRMGEYEAVHTED